MILLPSPRGQGVGPQDAEIDRLRGLALRDELTGLANRRAFLDRMQRACSDALGGGPVFSLVLLDLDGLKDINDTLGYQAGDRALREFGLALAGAVRAQDLVARIGGDEFAVVAGHASAEEAAAFYDRLRDLARGILRTVKPHSQAVILSAAVGQGVWGPESPTVESIFTVAETEMATAKASPPPTRAVDGVFRPRGRRVLGEELRSLLAMARHVNTAGAMTTLLRRASEQAAALIGAQAAGIFLVTDDGRLSGDELYRDGAWEPYLEDCPLGLGILGRTAASGIAEVHNVLTPDLVYDPALIDRFGLRSMLCVPLRDRRGGTIGVLTLSNKRGGQDFQESDVGLAQAFADLAASAIENARDYAAMEEARAELSAAEAETRRRNEELEARNEVAALLTGSQSVPAALNDVLPIIARVTEVDAALVMLADDEGRMSIAAGFKVPEAVADALIRTPLRMGERALGAAAAIREPVIVGDLAEAPRTKWQVLRDYGVQSFAVLPLVAGERVVGMLGASSFTTHAFDEARLSRLRAFADQIAVWLDSRTLLEETTQRAQEARFLADIGEALNETRDEAEILRRLAHGMAEKLGGGVLVVMRRADGAWQPAAVGHPDPRHSAAVRAAVGSQIWRAEDTPRELIEQVLSAKLFDLAAGTLPQDERWVQLCRQMGVHTMLVAPLAAGGQTLGVVVAGNHGRRPTLTNRQLDLAKEVAQHAAVAVANARALKDAEQSRTFLRAMMEQAGEAILVFAAQEDRIVDANAAAERLMGRTRAELLRCGMRDLAGRRGLRRWRRTVAHLTETGAGAERHVLRFRAGERRVTVEVSASPVAAPGGAVVMAVLRDISDELAAQRQRERLLRREREHARRARLLLDLAGRLARAESPESVMRIALAACRRLAYGGRAGISLWDSEHQLLRFGAAVGVSASEMAYLRTVTFDPTTVSYGVKFMTADTPVMMTPESDTSPDAAEFRRAMKAQSSVMLALHAGGELIGALGAEPRDRRRPFSRRDLAMLTGIARQTAVALSAVIARRRAEETRDYLETVMQHTGDGIVVTDRATGLIVDVTDPFCGLVGRARADLVGQPGLDLIRPDERVAAEANQATIGADCAPPSPVVRTLQRPDGESVPVEVTVRFMRQGGRDLVVSVVRDMRARRESDARLCRFAHTVDYAGEAIAVIGAGGIIVHANAATHRILGYPPEALIGMCVRSLLAEDSTPRALDTVTAGVLAGAWRGEVGMRRADGSPVLICATATPLRDDDDQVIGLVAVGDDISHEAAAQQARAALLARLTDANATALKRTAELRTIADLSGILVAGGEPETVFTALARRILDAGTFDVATIGLYDERKDELCLRVVQHRLPRPPAALMKLRGRPVHRSALRLLPTLLRERRPLIFHHGDALFRTSNMVRHNMSAEDLRLTVLTPLLFNGAFIGTLGLYARVDRDVPDDEVRVLQALADHVAAAVHNAESVCRIQDMRRDAIFRMALACETRDAETGVHLHRIQATTEALCRELGMPDAESDEIGLASVLHDIGKIAIPEAVLRKPGRLTPAEYRILQQHTIRGEEMLAGPDFYEVARQISRHHHERWDGAGYPDQLAGEAIPRAARIVAVADVYDALISERVYKDAWTDEDAGAEILVQAGRQFDPEVVDAFEALWRAGRLAPVSPTP